MPAKPENLVGKRYGWLTVAALSHRDPKTRRYYWYCICLCGAEHTVMANYLRNGDTTSCGCRMRTRGNATTHGKTGSRAYRAWTAMKKRCYRSDLKDYKNYGGRGITVCDRWRDSFENFWADMGDPPDGYMLERRENDKGYSPDNCEWATRVVQNRNKRNNRFLTLNGETKTLAEWGSVTGISSVTISARLKYGWPVEKALTQRLRDAH